MKKYMAYILSGLLFLSLYSNSYGVNLYLNNHIIVGEAPITVQGRTLVPVAIISEALGGKVNWNSGTKTVTIEKSGTVLKLKINSNEAYINDKKIKLDVPAQLNFGRTMVPINFISQAFGEKIEWNANTKSVLVNCDNGIVEDLNSYISEKKAMELLKKYIDLPEDFYFEEGEIRDINNKKYYLFLLSNEYYTSEAYCVDVFTGELFYCDDSMNLSTIY